MRVRADAVYEDPFGWDPACYLTLDERGITDADIAELKSKGEWYEPLEPAPDDGAGSDEDAASSDGASPTRCTE